MDVEPMERLKDAGSKGGPIGPPFLCVKRQWNREKVEHMQGMQG